MFNAFKLHRAPHDNRYFIYKIENDAEIVVDTFGDKSKTYDDFTACLPPNECRYGVFDLDFVTRDGRDANKIIFVSWSPDTAKIKNKMVYAASKVKKEMGVERCGRWVRVECRVFCCVCVFLGGGGVLWVLAIVRAFACFQS